MRRALDKLTKKFGNALDHAKGGVLVSQIGDEEEKENTVTSINEEKVHDTVNDRASIKTNSKGAYVQADVQVITSDDPAVQESQIIDYVNSVVRKGKDVDIPRDNGEKITITGRTAWKLGDKGNYTDEIYLVKGNAAGVIGEIIQTSQYKKTKPSMKEHTNGFASGGFDYRTEYFRDLDGKYYQLKLSIGINTDGKEAYNIGEIKEIPFPDKSVSGSKAVAGSKAKSRTVSLKDTAHRVNDVGHPVGYALENGIYSKTISQDKGIVNSNSMQKEKRVSSLLATHGLQLPARLSTTNSTLIIPKAEEKNQHF